MHCQSPIGPGGVAGGGGGGGVTVNATKDENSDKIGATPKTEAS